MKFSLEHILTLCYNHFRGLDRIGIVWYIGIIYAIFLLLTTFTYTVIHGKKYKDFANDQQTKIVTNPVSRGSIYSSEGSLRGVLAVSTNLGNLAIDPSQTGARDKLLIFLSDTVFDEFCTYSSPCIENMGKYLREDLSQNKNITVTDLKNKIKNYLQTKMDSPQDEVLVKANLDEATVQRIVAWQDSSLYFIANNLWINPTKVADKDMLGVKLAEALQISKEDVTRILSPRKRAHLNIINNMSISTRDAILKRIATEKESIKNDDLDLENSIIPFIKQADIENSDKLVRYYPERNITSQITGFVDHMGAGKYGIEGYFQAQLQIESPTQKVVKDAAGRPIGGSSSNTDMLNAKKSVDITLTIDRNIQKEISHRLARAVEKFRANKGSVIVMDPKTGAIISMVNYPDYDANSFTEVYTMEKVDYNTYQNPYFDLFGVPLFVIDTQSGTIFSNIEGQRLKLREATDDEVKTYAIPKYKYKNKFGAGVYTNDIITALYEPGSVFKALTVAIGLDTGEIKPTDTYYDRGYVELDYGGGQKGKISNVASACAGRHTYMHALNWSCNVGMIDIIQKIGQPLFHKYLMDFGLGRKTNITLDGEHFARIDASERWSRTQFFTMSFGQGINLTMLQMAVAYSILANGGVYMEPHIVESLTYPDGRRIETYPTPIRRVIKEETSKTITAMLIDGVRNGFAKKGGVPGYVIAGKTGTSQIPMRGGYENRILGQDLGHTITSYGGFAPANNPKFVLIIAMNRPRTDVYSENTSSALFAEIAQYLLEYYKIPKNNGI